VSVTSLSLDLGIPAKMTSQKKTRHSAAPSFQQGLLESSDQGREAQESGNISNKPTIPDA